MVVCVYIMLLMLKTFFKIIIKILQMFMWNMDHEAHFGTLEVVIRNISSSRCQMFFKIGVLQNFAIFTGKPCPPEHGGQRGRQTTPTLSVDVYFFADEPFKFTLFERSNQKCTWKSANKITSKLKWNLTD